jgi:hypothetical protein
LHLLGRAEAVIANLLADPGEQVARAEAHLWVQHLEVLMADMCQGAEH